MNKKNIEKVLTKKFKNYAKSILDLKVKRMVEQNTIITGGAIASMLLGEEVNDYDLYFTDIDTAEAVVKYYVDKFYENEVEVIREDLRIKIIIPGSGIAKRKPTEAEGGNDEKYYAKFITSNAISLSNKVQLVIRLYGNADEIHENYDFQHVTNYWESGNGRLTLRQEALESLLARELIYQGSLYPLCSIIRTRKFIKRGWHINAGQYLKMCFQVSQLDLKDVKVLEEQLIGVDTTYFSWLIDRMKDDLEKNKIEKIDSNYVCKIVDEIF